ncbi:hypothetical protein SZ63_09190 [Methanoculleus sediminis]|uniref:Uncharacterized protein n=1 Tax=Methanoculleus sediminis TaxID=1550566 RepID=A0A0H1R504_9EURY|nr:hypothetical protein SZ63_09190 [Methanoculleus sediminis]
MAEGGRTAAGACGRSPCRPAMGRTSGATRPSPSVPALTAAVYTARAGDRAPRPTDRNDDAQ